MLLGTIVDKGDKWVDVEMVVKKCVVIVMDPLENVVGIFSSSDRAEARWIGGQINMVHRVGSIETWCWDAGTWSIDRVWRDGAESF